MMQNKITRSDTNDFDDQDRASKKMRPNSGFMNRLHHEGGTSTNLSMHARLMNLCQHDIQLQQPTDQANKLLFVQTQVAKMSPQEKSQLLQNAFHASVNSSKVNASSLINIMIADDGHTLHAAMNNVNTTMSSPSLQLTPYLLSQRTNNRTPLKLQDFNVGHANMRNETGALVSYHSTPSTMIPYVVPLSLTQSTTTTTIRNNLYGIGNMSANSMQGERSIPIQLPVCMAQPADRNVLSEHQQFLRFQIEVFEATEADVRTHVRGRNKPIVIGQVGIRCRHCAHLMAARRQKGSTYFPASTIGLYQAAQNMCTAHIQCGMCSQMPDYIKEHFKVLIATKSFTSGAGKPYWSKSAKEMGLVDTEDGIFFNRSTSFLK